jgi:uncharacterized protein with von Willebrand factor type A (vWA) domain
MSKIKQTKIPVNINEPDLIQIGIEQGVIENEFNWKLVRERDKLTKQSKEVMWIEFDDDGRFKEKYDEPKVGRSLIMSPFNQFFTWQTTVITEIMEEKENYIKFKTSNSVYELFKLNLI